VVIVLFLLFEVVYFILEQDVLTWAVQTHF